MCVKCENLYLISIHVTAKWSKILIFVQMFHMLVLKLNLPSRGKATWRKENNIYLAWSNEDRSMYHWFMINVMLKQIYWKWLPKQTFRMNHPWKKGEIRHFLWGETEQYICKQTILQKKQIVRDLCTGLNVNNFLTPTRHWVVFCFQSNQRTNVNMCPTAVFNIGPKKEKFCVLWDWFTHFVVFWKATSFGGMYPLIYIILMSKYLIFIHVIKYLLRRTYLNISHLMYRTGNKKKCLLFTN